MRFNSYRKLLSLLPLLVSAFFAIGQNTTFTYLFDDGFGTPCAPASVNFYPQTTLVNPTYSWTVNGVTFSNQVEPIRVFPVGGNYNICLNVTAAGATEQYCEQITVFDPPTVTLDNDVDLGCNPLTVEYTITSTSNIDSIAWDLGDGTIINQNGNDSTEMVYTHVYTSGGLYTPIVTVFEEHGCEVTVTKPNAVQVIETPQPSFVGDETIGCTVPHTVVFTNTTTMIGNLSFYWDFGVDANSNSTQIHPTYTYTDLGSYDVTLVVTNNTTGCVDTLVVENYINIGTFEGFQYELLEDGDCAVTEVAFSFYDSGNIQSVTWDFGDGNSSTELNPVYTYTTAGCFTPSLTIVTTDGCTYNTTAPDCIQCNGPVSVDYTASGDLSTCDEVNGTTINFTGISTSAVSWLWNFGGQGTSTLQNPSFTFTGVGTYPVELTVMYPDSCFETITNVTVEIAPIQAGFSSNVVEGCKELQVFFSNETTSADPITSYQWNFDGGSGLTTIENPVVTFADTGAYDITLIVTTASGCTDTLLMEKYIKVGMQSGPGFSADPLISCLEDQIEFTSESGPLVDEWEWHFGDGGQSGEENPQHEYTDTGFFDVSLITFFHGCPDTLLVEEYVYINAPKAEFSFNQDCNSPGEIQFLDGSIGAETWDWDFGDGTSSTIPNPAHTYSANGSYLVNLTVSNSVTGCSHSEGMTVNVTTSVPEFSLSSLNICAGDTISVINNSVGADCYTWSFPFGVGMITNSFCDEDPQFYFPVAGDYYGFCLTITDGTSCNNTYCLTDTIHVSGVVSDFATNDILGCAPHSATFTNSAYAINGNVTNYLWTFGDSTTSTDANPTHIYNEMGTYDVSLVVENQAGCTDELVMTELVTVDKIEPFFIPQVTDCSTQSVDFTNASTAYDTNLSYLWDFGDGSTSTSKNPSHSYVSSGNYTICLTVENSWGCSEQFCDDINFQPLSANFVADETYKSCPEPPLVSNFTDLSVNASSWSWDFGDGASSALQNPSHSYNQKGFYTVCLTVTNVLGCSTTECKTDYIEVDGPKGTLTVTPVSGCADLEVEYIVESENAFKYKWDFGDGFVVDSLASGDSDTIHHTYTNGGTYDPVVLIEDVSGCQIPVIGESVLVEDIITDFLASINEVCENGNTPIDFVVAFADPSSVIAVNWEFPGSETPTATGLNPTGIIYNQPGYYDVILHANTTYCQTTVTKDSFIFVHPVPTTDFVSTPANTCNLETISFQDASSIGVDSITSWNWTVDNNTFTDTNFAYQFTSTGNYNVTLETTSSFGCVSSTQQTVTVFENPIVDAGENTFICQGENTMLTASVQTPDPVTYTWSPATNLSCTNCTSPIASPTSTTLYYVTATTVNGCVSTDSVQVEVSVLPPMVVTVSADTTICEGEEVVLSSGSNQLNESYEWNTFQSGLSCYDCPNPTASPTDTTTYTITIYSVEGCSASNSVTVNVIPTVDLIDENPVICLGESVQLQLAEGTDILWQPADGLSCDDCLDPVASPDSTTTYTVTALTAGQCTVTDEVTVNVLTEDDIDAGEDFEICEGVVTTLAGSYPFGTSVWTFNGDIIATDTPNPEITATQSGYYILEVTNGSCVLSDTIAVQVRDKVEIFAEDITICEGDTAHLEVTGDAESYTWINAVGLSDPTSATPFVIPSETTTYMVIGEYGQCESDTQLVVVEVLPLADIHLPEIEYFAEGDVVNMNANVTNGDNFTYTWSPPLGLSCTDCPDPSVEPEEDIIYHLTVLNDLGCLDSASILLRKIFICNDELIMVPNAFTPNGDGNNDKFNVWSELQIGMVRIYNRWGEVVFEDVGGKKGWDGTYKGEKLNRDVFVYYIEATCEFNGKTIVKTGDVTLIR